MSDAVSVGSSIFCPGDRAQQIALVGLAPVSGVPYVVVDVDGDGLILSRTPNGPPLVDLDDRPRHYPPQKFRKVTWD